MLRRTVKYQLIPTVKLTIWKAFMKLRQAAGKR